MKIIYDLLSRYENNKLVSMLQDEELVKQFIRYFITGITSFTIEYTLFSVLLVILKFHYIVSSVVVYVFVFWFVFLVNRFWSFKSKGNIGRQLGLYILLFVFNLIVPNILVMYLLTDVIGISAMLSKVLIMFIVVSWNFIIYKKVIYTEN